MTGSFGYAQDKLFGYAQDDLWDAAKADNDKSRSRFPAGMTTRKASATATAKANAAISPLRRQSAPPSVEMTRLR
jgi:hypothetical protein